MLCSVIGSELKVYVWFMSHDDTMIFELISPSACLFVFMAVCLCPSVCLFVC